MLDRVQHRARKLGITIDPSATRGRLVRSIQRAEGRQACFKTNASEACRSECEWATECRGLVAEWLR